MVFKKLSSFLIRCRRVSQSWLLVNTLFWLLTLLVGVSVSDRGRSRFVVVSLSDCVGFVISADFCVLVFVKTKGDSRTDGDTVAGIRCGDITWSSVLDFSPTGNFSAQVCFIAGWETSGNLAARDGLVLTWYCWSWRTRFSFFSSSWGEMVPGEGGSWEESGIAERFDGVFWLCCAPS